MRKKDSASNKQLDTVTIPLNSAPVGLLLTLKISNDHLLPQQISQLLNLEPSRSYCKGEIKPPAPNPKASGLWALSSAHMEDQPDLNLHVQWLLAQFADKKHELNQLREQGCKISLVCRFGIAHWNTAFSCTPENIELIASLRVPLIIDVYDEQWDEE